MTERIARAIVNFDKPFFVEGLGHDYSAGSYEVEIIEEQIENLSFIAYRVVSTSIMLPLPGGGANSYQLVRINSALVRTALRNGENGDRQQLHYVQRTD